MLKQHAKKIAEMLINRIARDYSAGADIEDGLRVSQLLVERGYSYTLGYWNREDENPDDVVSLYAKALVSIGRAKGNGYLSVKAPAFHYDKTCFDELCAKSIACSRGLHFDSMWPESVDQTFALIHDVKVAHPELNVGITLPGRWQRSVKDAELAKEMNSPVRLVKGQWKDCAQPGMDMQKGFLKVVEALLGHTSCVRIATHDTWLAKESLNRLLVAGVPCELELLYGLPVRRMLRMAGEIGITVRIYVPFGKEWIPYCLNHLRKEPGRILRSLGDFDLRPYLARFPEQDSVQKI